VAIEVNLRSDNVAAAAPEILEALVAANTGTDSSYGADAVTAGLQDRFRELFETECFVHPVATGTAMNALSLALLTPAWGAVVCSGVAHISDSECGAAEMFTGGAKVLPLPHRDGKLESEALQAYLKRVPWGSTHSVQPAVLSLTQGTERGTLYNLEEIAQLASIAHEYKLRVHMDGARFANAVAALGCRPAEMTWRLGVDVLSFGATKNGAMSTEAVVVFDQKLKDPLRFLARKSGHVLSKMRFASTQLEAYLEGGLWLRLASNANAVASRLAQGLQRLGGVELLYPVEINEIFARLPRRMIEGLAADGIGFYDRGGGEVRLVTAFNTRPEQIDHVLSRAAGYVA
jgi:threonine aldolase